MCKLLNLTYSSAQKNRALYSLLKSIVTNVDFQIKVLLKTKKSGVRLLRYNIFLIIPVLMVTYSRYFCFCWKFRKAKTLGLKIDRKDTPFPSHEGLVLFT